MCNKWIMGIPGRLEEEEREKGMEEIFETIMTENFIQLMPNTKSQIKEDQRTRRRINVRSTPRYVIFKLHETKYKNSKRSQRKRTPDL